MSYVIAVSGKGGMGKSTVAALIIRLLKEKKSGSVLAVDADPNSNLADLLGLKAAHTVGGILDDISSHPEKISPGMPKDRFIEFQIQSAIEETEGFDLLTMGRPEGPGCYCYVNNVLRNIMAKLIKDYDYVVIDNEAGLEHLSRRTTRSCDTMLVISDPTPVGLKSAQRIDTLIKELDIKVRNRLLLINRSEADIADAPGSIGALEYLGSLPVDEQVFRFSMEARPLLDLESDAKIINALRKLGDRIWH